MSEVPVSSLPLSICEKVALALKDEDEAKLFYQELAKMLEEAGVPGEDIRLIAEDEATHAEILKILKGMCPQGEKKNE